MPISDDYRYTDSVQNRKEDVAYEYPFPPTTLQDEADQHGHSNVNMPGPGNPQPEEPWFVAGTAGCGPETTTP